MTNGDVILSSTCPNDTYIFTYVIDNVIFLLEIFPVPYSWRNESSGRKFNDISAKKIYLKELISKMTLEHPFFVN